MHIPFQRAWGMPSADTFECEPILGFVQKYLLRSVVSVDPFARNSRLAKYRNDLNPNTQADYHMDAEEFCNWLRASMVVSDLVIFDPPYSPRQISECYESFGKHASTEDTQNSKLYSRTRDAIEPMISRGGIVLSFGWNSGGMGIARGFELIDILLVCHGGAHNDTICIAERKLAPEASLQISTESDEVLRKLDEKLAPRIDAFRESERVEWGGK